MNIDQNATEMNIILLELHAIKNWTSYIFDNRIRSQTDIDFILSLLPSDF